MPTPASSLIAELPPRERILATAHRLFYLEGIRASGIDRVIAESGVSKVTFYRHFPSKNELILAYLQQRHQLWMQWFQDALNRHAEAGPAALADALAEWFASADFRGCAFINGLGEILADAAVADAARHHKTEMRQAIASLLPKGDQQARQAGMLALAADGAIVRAQIEGSPDAAIAALRQMIPLLTAR
ncbi:TetR/AcrR family transcriptional regulator [Chromobacterium amazonense]|uniref:TetR/AcrR family transcriptional regulator n=1 Tax=Chromobacterium amazonense TaxID=1382803 RepID=UPI003F795AFA